MGVPPERRAGCWEHPATQEENRRTREQIIWRLERLLGDTSNDGRMVGEAPPPSESICTEDFARRFRDEMVELTLPESDVEQLDKEEEAERTDCDTCQPGRVVNADGKGRARPDRSDTGAENAPLWRFNEPRRGGELERCLSASCGANTSSSEEAGPRKRRETLQRMGDSGSSEYSFYGQTCSFRIKTNVKYTCLSACCCSF